MAFSGRIFGLGCFLGSPLDASGLFFTSFHVFRHPMASYFLNFNHIFDFTYRGILKSRLLYSIFLFYVAICEEAWSAELPEGSIFMF